MKIINLIKHEIKSRKEYEIIKCDINKLFVGNKNIFVN